MIVIINSEYFMYIPGVISYNVIGGWETVAKLIVYAVIYLAVY